MLMIYVHSQLSDIGKTHDIVVAVKIVENANVFIKYPDPHLVLEPHEPHY